MSGRILLTGATGFVGTQVARWVLRETGYALVALVRAEDDAAAERRLRREWWDWPELASAVGERVLPLAGDVTRPHLGLSDEVYSELVRSVTHVIHAAADFRIGAPIEQLREANVTGTANVLDFARAAHRDHGLERFAHVSTAYVAGRREGVVAEEDLTAEHGFASGYEETKHAAERMVEAAKAEMPVSIFRPGMIVGDSRTGAIKTFNTVYFPLRLYLAGQLRVVPASPSLRVNVVPIDYVAEAIGRLTFDPRAVGLTFHLTLPKELLPTVGELFEFVREWAAEHLGARLPKPILVPTPPLAIRLGCRALRALGGDRGGTLRGVEGLAPYFAERRVYRRDNVDRLLGPCDLRWRDTLGPMLEYAAAAGFLHRSGRTVHEQVLFRLASRSRPVTYYDVADGEFRRRTASEVRWDILAATAALRALGVEPGDRVGIVGLNSTRYLAVDVAVGLVGAVTVPLYYTSPPSEVDEILRASGARVLLVGAPKLLERLGELGYRGPVVSFCRGPIPAGTGRDVVPWDEFLALGAGETAVPAAPVEPEDLATIRYTSGTTGRPKGVTFTHASLRWMAEAVAGLLPWEARNRKATSLSYLPLNHVVEGILAMYSPYYLPAPIDVYFLEEFRDLQQTLPKVRPTVLFSVARFYEKLYDAVRETSLGRYCAREQDGLLRRALRPLVRWMLLRRAGLGRCAQLIVGSGPSSEDVLSGLRRLGVEVHNAYGLTEAPLVTINRLGRNRLGTVGEPLPRTEVRLAEDGEVMVRGPQVSDGYFGGGSQPALRDGWLLTGDLGHLTDEGSLVLSGRKKELIATAYGKKVQPAKVEGLLREIPGVSEAMLVGEARPHCAALLWVRDVAGDADGALAESVDLAVARANARLSHPEQVKAWAVLRDDLSIERGDLTANLKLKRAAVASRLRGVVEALYGGPTPDVVLHLGRAEKTVPEVPGAPPTPPRGSEEGERRLASVGAR